MSIKVKAKKKGLYGKIIRNPGDEFEIADEKAFSKRWMVNLDAKAPSTGSGQVGAKAAVTATDGPAPKGRGKAKVGAKVDTDVGI